MQLRPLVLGAAIWVCLCGAAEASNPTNLIVILADDMGWADVGPYDHDDNAGTPLVTNTPRLDLMASQGVQLREFYTSAVCSPSRAGLLTGRHPSRFGVTGPYGEMDPDGMDPAEITIAEVLGAAGYQTACVGKWHLGEPVQYLPTNQGFDTFYGPPYSNDIVPFYMLRDTTIVDPNPDQAMMTSDFTTEAKAEITAAYTAGKPFFLFLSHCMPHVPVYASPAFTGSTGRGLYADAIAELDWSVGEILDHLATLGIDSDTMVVFLSDNGPWSSTHGPEPWSSEPWRWVGGRADPLAGSKATLLEGGVRSPFIARFPGQVPAGVTLDQPCTIMDIFTTFVNLGGGQLPTDRVIDGQDLFPLLAGTGTRPDTPAFLYDPAGGPNQGVLSLEAIRAGRYKQHFAPNFQPTELFDLALDESETTPLVLPKVTAVLEAQAREFDCTIDDPPFEFPPSPNAALGATALASSAVNCDVARDCLDGAKSTRWHSAPGADQWLEVDLGAKTPIEWIGLRWGVDYARRYRVLISNDGSTWTTVKGMANGDGGLDGFFLGVSARHVRVRCIESAQGAGYGLRELQVLSVGHTDPIFEAE